MKFITLIKKLFCLFLICMVCIAKAYSTPLTTASHPSQKQVNVYFGQLLLGKTTALYHHGFLEFTNKAFFIKHLTFVNDPKTVADYLMAKLDVNHDLICNKKLIKQCSYLNPKTVAIIFNRHKHRVRLFINAKFLKKAEKENIKYIKPHHTPLGFVDRTAIMSTGTNNESKFTLTNVSTLAKNNKALIIDSNFTTYLKTDDDPEDHNAYQISDLDYEVRTPNQVRSVGYLGSDSMLFIPSFSLLGVNVKKNQELIQNNHINYGSAIEVNLTSPSLVEVFKGNKILYSNYLNVGNHFLNTNNFPNGYYEVRIVITTLYGNKIKRNQFFIKNNTIPPMGHPSYNLTIGALNTGFTNKDDTLPTVSHNYIEMGTYTRRLNKTSDVEIGELANHHYAIVSSAYNLFGKRYQASVTGAIDSQHDYGIGGTYNLNYNKAFMTFFVRRFYTKNHYSDDQLLNNPFDTLLNDTFSSGINIGYSGKNNTINVGYSHDTQNEADEQNEYSFDYTKKFIIKHKIRANLEFNISRTGTDNTYLATLSLSLIHHNFTHTMNGKWISPAGNDFKNIDQSYGYTLAYNKRKKYKVTGGIDWNENQIQLDTSLERRFKRLAIYGDMAYTKPNTGDSSYIYAFGLNQQTNVGFGWSKGKFGLSSDLNQNTATMIQVHSNIPGSQYSVHINNKQYRITANTSRIFGLDPYKKNVISITPLNPALYINQEQHTAILYPYNLMPIKVSAHPFNGFIGDIIYPNGRPVTFALIHSTAKTYQTNGSGFTTIYDVGIHDLLVTPVHGPSCLIKANSFINQQDRLYYLNKLICRPSSL